MTHRAPLVLLFALTVWGPSGGGLRAQVSAFDFPHGPLPAGLGCADCHGTQAWKPLNPDRSFDHGEVTGFRLEGRHGDISCVSCHEGLRFSARAEEAPNCSSCHLDVHQGSLPADCARCHTPQSFSEISGLRIHQTTGFALEGAHLQLVCQSCHVDDQEGAFSPLSVECLSCHQEDFQRPKGVDHLTLGFPGGCLTCHSPRSWTDVASFDHPTFSGGFQLLGAHEDLLCRGCHLQGGGLRFPTPAGQEECVSCHQADYQEEHAGSGYPTTCLTCHTATTWDGAAVDHVALSEGYVLEGAHDVLPCTSCHVPGGSGTLFNPTSPGDCVTCHQADYQEEHAGSGFPTECTECHTVTTWEGAQADHSAMSDGFSLVGNHNLLDCASCHAVPGMEPLFQPTAPDDCVACHQADYQREHTGSGYPLTCLTCHTATTWGGAQADHVALSGGFSLVGNHNLLDCASCHAVPGMEPLFQPTAPDDCVACHQADYQREHTGSGYPSTCLTCHTATTWGGAQADHVALSGGFSLVGNHNLLDCASCHILPGMEPVFTPSDPEDCVACHIGDFQREHSGSSYPSTCLICHTPTTWNGAQFNHDATYFPIYSGKHQGDWNACTDCHVSPTDYRVFSCLNCHKHQKSAVDEDHSEVSGYVYVSAMCLSCHPTGNG